MVEFYVFILYIIRAKFRNTISPEALISGIGMEKGRITVDCNMRTNIEGIFACGDCAVQPLQVSNAVGSGLIAGQNAAKYKFYLKFYAVLHANLLLKGLLV